MPSPALTTDASTHSAHLEGGAAGGVADDEAVDAHRADGQHGVAQPLALGRARPLGADVDDVGGEPLAGDLEGRARARGVLEEHVDHRAAAQRRQLLDLAALHVVHVGGGLEDLADLVGAQVVDGEQVLHEMVTSSMPSTSARRTLTRSARALGRFLPTWSARIGQLAVAAVDQHGEAYGAGPAEVGQRVERGADRPPGEQHVVDQDDDLVVDAAGGQRGLVRAAGGLRAQVVAVHRHVELADRDGRALDGGDLLRDPVRQRHAAGVQPEQHQVGRRPCCARGARARCGSAPGRCHGRRGRCESAARRLAGAPSSGQVAGICSPDLLLRLTGRLVKGCRSRATLPASALEDRHHALRHRRRRSRSAPGPSPSPRAASRPPG